MKITNKEKLIAQLDEYYKYHYDLDAVIEDIEKDIMINGLGSGFQDYEIHSYESKSGHAELICYTLKITFLVDGEWITEEEYDNLELEEFDNYEYEAIF